MPVPKSPTENKQMRSYRYTELKLFVVCYDSTDITIVTAFVAWLLSIGSTYLGWMTLTAWYIAVKYNYSFFRAGALV